MLVPLTEKYRQHHRSIQNTMRPHFRVTYSVGFITTSPTGQVFIEPVYKTYDKAAWDILRKVVQTSMRPLSKTVGDNGGKAAREIQVFNVVDVDKATQYFERHRMPAAILPGTVFRSIREAAAALGLKESSLKQMLYVARSSSISGLDQDIVVRGYEVGYSDKSRSMGKDRRGMPILPEPPVGISAMPHHEFVEWEKAGSAHIATTGDFRNVGQPIEGGAS